MPISYPSSLDDHSKEQLKGIIAETHGISEDEISEYMPEILEDIKAYTKDHMILETNFEEKCPSKEDQCVHQFYLSNVEEVFDQDGQRRLQLPLPWKIPPFSMPGSFTKAKQRLQSQMKRLRKSPERLSKYRTTVKNMIKENHIEEVGDKELNFEDYLVHYLTHFATLQEKFRVVYDASLKNGKFCLNDLLYRGPMFLPSIVEILMRFREFQFAFCGDIQNMFFQIGLHPKDQDMLRVLFYDDDGKTLKHYRFKVQPYGIRPVPSIAGFCINYTANKNYAKVGEDVVHTAKNSVYVDDVLKSVPSIEKGQATVTGLKALFASTGFHMRKWSSNCKEILKDISTEDLSPTMKSIDAAKDGGNNHKALGVRWNPETDKFEMAGSIKTICKDDTLTQRKSLRYLNSHFDPLGLWCPFFVPLKLIYSKIAKSVDGWDFAVSNELTVEWCKAATDLGGIKMVSFPRWYMELPPTSVFELHLFSDSSEFAIGACVYLRAFYNEKYETALVYGKSKNIPSTQVRKFSIARKELIALDMGVDLLHQCCNALSIDISKSTLWTDSTTVIKWCLCQTKELLTLVANRVDKVLSCTKGEPPKYVDSHKNPADIASRGLNADEIGRISLWKYGPDFLRQPAETWDPQQNRVPSDTDENVNFQNEIKPKGSKVYSTKVENGKNKSLATQLESLGTVTETETAIVYLRRCLLAWRDHTKRSNGDPDALTHTKMDSTPRYICQERVSAKEFLVKLAQNEEMSTIIKLMSNGMTYEEAFSKIPTSKREKWMRELRKYIPFLDEHGVLRMGGRLQNSKLLFVQKHPAFLPRRHWITRRYITGRHEELGHLGKDTVFSSLVQDLGLWIVGNASTVKHYLVDCAQCTLSRQVRGAQLMSSLPSERVLPRQYVWSNTAIDYAGPFDVVAGRGTTKRYLCVFVCMATTAVRIMVARDLTTPFFLTVLRRFLASTNYVTKKLRSDNGKNFVGAKNVMQKEEVKAALSTINTSSELKSALTKWNIDWEFGVPEASHHGGLYERQIRTIRQIICTISDLSHRTPTEDELQTCFADAEYIMNCRPLTKSPTDDGMPPLRPRELITGALEPVEHCGPPKLSNPGDELRRGYLYSRRIAEQWWDRWISEYLPQLQSRQKWLSEKRNLKIGDLVILCDEKRLGFLKYPYAIIVDVKMDSDGLVRSVKARMSDGTIRNRDIRKIALIDTTDQ